MTARHLRRYCALGRRSEALLRQAVTRLGLSARAYHRILKIARTIADLDGADYLDTGHVSEAIQYRSLDRTKVGRLTPVSLRGARRQYRMMRRQAQLPRCAGPTACLVLVAGAAAGPA